MLGTVVAGPAAKLLVLKKRSVPWAATAMMAMAREHDLSLTVIWYLLRQWTQEKLLYEE